MRTKSVTEKVDKFLHSLDTPEFSDIIYRRGASGTLSPVLRGTGIRVQTITLPSQNYTRAEIVKDYNWTLMQV